MTRGQWIGMAVGAAIVAVIVVQWADIERYRRILLM
jgi:hypothetical protein